jgi:hypothetical protein
VGRSQSIGTHSLESHSLERRTADPSPSIAGRARIALLVTIGVTAVLYAIPQLHIVAYPLILIGTLVHELGHGVAAMLVGGSFHSLAVYADGSGVAGWGHQADQVGRLGRALVSAGGLVGPAVAAAILFPMARRPGRARWALGAIGVALLIALVFVVRNGFGVALVGILAVVCLVLAVRASAQVAQFALIFLAVQLSLSVFSRSDYLFTETAQTGAGAHPSDVAHMAEALLLPYWLWGALCGLFSIGVLAIGTWLLVRGDRRRPVARSQRAAIASLDDA